MINEKRKPCFIDLQIHATGTTKIDTTTNAGLIMKAWAKQLWKDAQVASYFDRFTGSTPDNIIQKVEDLKKDAGDSITFSLVVKLAGDGITGDSTLEGNEEAMNFSTFSVQIDQIRNAVRIDGEMTEKRTQFNLRNTAKEVLKIWLAEKMEQEMFKELSKDPDGGADLKRTVFAGTATSINALSATDVFEPSLISKAKRMAMLASPKIRPANVNGKNWYVMLISPYQARDLKANADWKEAQINANVRGDENPIFSGALGYWDGVVIHEHEYVVSETNSDNVRCDRGLFLGCQSGVLAIGKEPFWKEKSFDYENQVGFATGYIRGVAKPRFTILKDDGSSETHDFGMIQVITAAPLD